jgi:hypothetical protein
MKHISRFPLPLAVALLLSLVNGLIFVFIMPPWQHYDEPTHFEYSWLIANQLRMPHPGDFDPDMRREVAQSMIDAGFFKGLGYLPDLTVSDGQVWIGGYSQLDGPPVYYLMAAIPMILLINQPVAIQLYAARIVSISLLLVSICAVFGMISELTPSGSPFRWLVPCGVAMLPGYIEMMSSVNNDVAAAAFMALFLWSAVRLVLRGFSWGMAIISGVSAGFCLLSKETAYIAVPLWLVAMAFAMLRKDWGRRLVWIAIISGSLALVVASIGWGDAALWYRMTDQPKSSRQMSEGAPIGKAIIQIRLEDANQTGGQTFQLNQFVPPEAVNELRGQVVTVGAWMWADSPVTIPLPVLTAIKLNQGANQALKSVEIGVEPAFYAFQASIPEDTASLQIGLSSRANESELLGNVYLDGLVLAIGEYPLNEAPIWDDVKAMSGTWGGKPFNNIIRNGSGESSWPRLYPWIDNIGSRLLPDQGRPSLLLYAFLDWKAGEEYFKATAINMLKTFWGRFGWGHVLLQGKSIYWTLAGITILGLVGCVAVFRKKFLDYQFETLFVVGLAVFVAWSLAVVRGVFYIFYWPFIPGARYAFPVIGPTIGILAYGWWVIITSLKKVAKINDWIYLGGLGLAMLALDIWSIVSILRYYAG